MYSYVSKPKTQPKDYSDGGGETKDRDERVVAAVTARGDLTRGVLSKNGRGNRGENWGGALRRMTSSHLFPSREDERKFISVPGRYVPLGFARYVSPVIDPLDYTLYRIAGWRVAIPRAIPGPRVRDLLYRIFYFGPQSAGFVRMGDTLVPAILESGDRMTLAQTNFGFGSYPLTQ